MQTTIGIEGIHCTAPIGVYDWEKKAGREFVIDIYLKLDLNFDELNDDLSKTINYEIIYQIVETTMENSFDLIESVPLLINELIVKEFPSIASVKIRVRKVKPILNANLDSVYVEAEFQNIV